MHTLIWVLFTVSLGGAVYQVYYLLNIFNNNTLRMEQLALSESKGASHQLGSRFRRIKDIIDAFEGGVSVDENKINQKGKINKKYNEALIQKTFDKYPELSTLNITYKPDKKTPAFSAPIIIKTKMEKYSPNTW